METDRKKLFKTLAYLIFFILIANFAAHKLYWYSSIPYFDMIMHFLGGFWLGLFFIWLLKPKDAGNSPNFTLKILLCVFLVGVGWEVFEMLVNDVIAQNPFDLEDTASDIFFDLFGGLCAILYIYQSWKKRLK